MNINAAFLDDFLESIALLFGDTCEIVVHDFTNGLEHTIVKILNDVTHRSIGDSPTNLFFERFQEQANNIENFPVYFTDLPDGRTLKSVTTFIRNDSCEIEGAVCINIDVTNLIRASRNITSLLGREPRAQGDEIYAHSLNELMDYYLNQVELNAGKPASEMSKHEKLHALDYLENKGVLHMAKSSIRLCEFFGFSKFTLYNYLDEVRELRLNDASS